MTDCNSSSLSSGTGLVVTSLTGAFETELIEALSFGLKNLLNSSSFSTSLLTILSNFRSLALLTGSDDSAGRRKAADGAENVTFFAGRGCEAVDEGVGAAEAVDEAVEGVEVAFVDEGVDEAEALGG